MTKSIQMWSVVEVFEDAFDVKHHSFITEEELRSFLTEKLEIYYIIHDDECTDEEYGNYTDNITNLIEKVTDTSSYLRDTGCGRVVSVHMLDFENQEIEVYE